MDDSHSVPAELPHPPPRYAPEVALPPYAYVPEQTPHPVSDPAGHAYGQPRPLVTLTDTRDITTHGFHRHAIDLFNQRYFWEAHEAWEALWIAAGRTGPVADLLKGLIKLAAAGVKARVGNHAGMVRHARRALELIRHSRDQWPHDNDPLGLEWTNLQAIAERYQTFSLTETGPDSFPHETELGYIQWHQS